MNDENPSLIDAFEEATPEQRTGLLLFLAHQLPRGQSSHFVQSGVPHPSPDELMPYIERLLASVDHRCAGILANLKQVLYERGKQYGEEVLVLQGEPGILSMCKVKAHRIGGSLNMGADQAERRDSWIDLAGYAVLAVALNEWSNDQ